MCERCKGNKFAALQLLAAHVPALAETVAQRVALDDLWGTFQEIYHLEGGEDSVKARAAKLWQQHTWHTQSVRFEDAP